MTHEYSQADNTPQLYQKSPFHGQQHASFFLEHYFGLHLKYKNSRALYDIHSIYVLIYEKEVSLPPWQFLTGDFGSQLD